MPSKLLILTYICLIMILSPVTYPLMSPVGFNGEFQNHSHTGNWLNSAITKQKYMNVIKQMGIKGLGSGFETVRVDSNQNALYTCTDLKTLRKEIKYNAIGLLKPMPSILTLNIHL